MNDIGDITQADIAKFRPLHVLANLRRSLDEAADVDRLGMLEMLSNAIEDYRRGCPMPILTDAMADAKWWASCAPVIELEAYLIAIGAVLSETKIHSQTRKRIGAAMFSGMTTSDRLAFAAWTKKQNEEAQ